MTWQNTKRKTKPNNGGKTYHIAENGKSRSYKYGKLHAGCYTKTKIYPSKTRGGKELPSRSALDSPSVISKLATPPHAINSDTLQVVDDATSAMNATHDDASTLLDDNVH